ncbi:uncharacterized protein LOC122259651 [Penaeus japonicus]|uniref:uncharacterized protein LOC122259651 n=1 Tax=Penaeus japonicus TaxID=27405 RepID=UPI001C7117A1|nr:uncharacterized protein LOC122259651 [Penaeus japonicus]
MGKRKLRRGLVGESEAGPSGESSRDDSNTSGELTLLPRENMDISLFDELQTQINSLKTLVNDLQVRNSELELKLEQNRATPSTSEASSRDFVEYVVQKEAVIIFKAETSAAQPLKRNQEVESWIRSIENLTRPPTDSAYIRAAKASCRGTADLIINGPLFDRISSWEEFKVKVRVKFRGTCSATDFFRILEGYKLKSDQAPLDFYVRLEGNVYQGFYDYPGAIGDPDELIRRVFLRGLPFWLREALVLKEDGSLSEIVDASQRIWNLRVGVKGESEGNVSTPETAGEPEYPRRSLRPRQVAPVERYCSYHKSDSHDTADCRSRQLTRCFLCKKEGHFANRCPFLAARRDEEVPTPGGGPQGTSNAHVRLLPLLVFKEGLTWKFRPVRCWWVIPDIVFKEGLTWKFRPVVVQKTVQCPPHSGVFIHGQVQNGTRHPEVCICGITDRVLVPRTVVTVKTNMVNVWVVNDGPKPVTLKGGMVIARVEPVEQTFHQDSASREVPPKNFVPTSREDNDGDSLSSVTEDFIDDFDDFYGTQDFGYTEDQYTVFPEVNFETYAVDETEASFDIPKEKVNHLTVEQRYQLFSILNKFPNLFKEGAPLGKVPGISHRIVTSSETPLRTRQWRLPEHARTTIREECDKMLTGGIIEPSKSPWLSPVVLVRKKDGQFARLPFGLATAPSTFQRAINTVLAPVLGRHVLAYLDDVVVYSRSFEEHLEHLEETLDLLSKAGFCLNVGKSSFATHEFKFLGYLITREGIQPDPAKVEAIKTMKPPQNVKGVRQFLGCTGFFRKHIPSYAMIAAPLTSLTRKGRSFRWTEEHQQAFEELQRRLMSAPVLRKPDFNRPFEVHSDASQVAIGACIMQRDGEGVPHAVAYFSRKLREVERRYPVIDIEALAVVEAVRNFDPYLYGKAFVIYTDHRPLVYVFKQVTKSIRMTRWSHELSFYQYELRYKPGASHHVPDLLSRAVAATSLVMDAQKIAEEQQKDPLWTEIIQYLQEQRLPRRRTPFPLEEFEVSDGLLYHLRHLPDRVIQQLVIPRTMRDEAIRSVHSEPTAAHPGVYRTYTRLRDQYYFPQMLLGVKKFVAACPQCQRRKGVAVRRGDTGYGEGVGRSSRFARISEWLPLRSGHRRTSYQVCEMLKIKLGYTTAFHPQANGMVERSNRVIKDALATLEIDEGSAQRFRERLKEARAVAVETARRAQSIWAEDYNRRVRQKFTPAEGDLVLVREYARRTGVAGRALGSRWSGPLRVKKQVGPVTFICQSTQPPYREKGYHCNQMKRYVVQEELEFFPEAEVDDGTDDPGVPGASNRE